ncbi:hypothetical protein ACFC26_12260 [Kitasatospora purpeofusca]|uniref:hypothetical protein n=1 Tax=Kitasatospora purpeofusca TaxID=67352 RepID=UPI0035E14433
MSEPIRIPDEDLDDLASALARTIAEVRQHGVLLDRLGADPFGDEEPNPAEAEPEGPASLFILAMGGTEYAAELAALDAWVPTCTTTQPTGRPDGTDRDSSARPAATVVQGRHSARPPRPNSRDTPEIGGPRTHRAARHGTGRPVPSIVRHALAPQPLHRVRRHQHRHHRRPPTGQESGRPLQVEETALTADPHRSSADDLLAERPDPDPDPDPVDHPGDRSVPPEDVAVLHIHVLQPTGRPSSASPDTTARFRRASDSGTSMIRFRANEPAAASSRQFPSSSRPPGSGTPQLTQDEALAEHRQILCDLAPAHAHRSAVCRFCHPTQAVGAAT